MNTLLEHNRGKQPAGQRKPGHVRRPRLSWYTDLGFIVLAVGAIAVLGFQMLKSDAPAAPSPHTLAVSDYEAAAHFGGRLSLVVTSPTTYVMRVDGTRFTTGDTLPGGMVLEQIDDTRLLLQSPDGDVLISIP